MARTKRRGKVARKTRVQTRRNNAMKPRVQSRRTTAVKKSVRRKRPKRKKIRGGALTIDEKVAADIQTIIGSSDTNKEKVETLVTTYYTEAEKDAEKQYGEAFMKALQSIPEAKELIINYDLSPLDGRDDLSQDEKKIKSFITPIQDYARNNPTIKENLEKMAHTVQGAKGAAAQKAAAEQAAAEQAAAEEAAAQKAARAAAKADRRESAIARTPDYDNRLINQVAIRNNSVKGAWVKGKRSELEAKRRAGLAV